MRSKWKRFLGIFAALTAVLGFLWKVFATQSISETIITARGFVESNLRWLGVLASAAISEVANNALLAAGIGVLVGIVLTVIIGVLFVWVRTRFWPPPKQRGRNLYLSLEAQGSNPDPWKFYEVCWSPTVNLGIRLSNQSHHAKKLGKEYFAPEKEEKTFVLYLFNAGPDDIRHVLVKWALPEFDHMDVIKKLNLFDGCVAKLERNYIEFAHKDSGAMRPLSNPEEIKIPLIKANETERLTSPGRFQGVLSIACLAIAKTIEEQHSKQLNAEAFSSFHELTAQIKRPFPRMTLDLQYTTGDGSLVEQSFTIYAEVYRGLLQDGKGLVPNSICGSIHNIAVRER